MIARPSVASLPLAPRFHGTALGTATGFVVQREGRSLLITNWHVVAGKRPDTGAILSETGRVPDQLVIVHNQAGTLGRWVERTEPLLTGAGLPRWLEHPVHGRQVDVVALELSDMTGVEIYPHDPWTTSPNIAGGVADGLSIIGFPFGITGGGALGIWVRGWVASEPSIDFNGLPCFLVDSRTRPGQSGSPVVFYQSGGAVSMADGGTAIFSGPVERFLGVYSGRLNDQSDLGFVWKASAVRDIVEDGTPGTA